VEPFPEDVARFMLENIETIDQLEILRILGENPGREWDCVTLAREVQANAQAVRGHVAALSARGVLTMIQQGTAVACRHGAATPELESMVGRLLHVYKERPVTMIKMVYQRAKDPLRAFADAFRIRKEE
jgi:DNA-binding transcriptional LysR family regulator